LKTLVTDAPLKAVQKSMAKDCVDYHEWVDIGPVKTFPGEPFREADPRKVRYDAHKCDNYPGKLEKTSALGVCGMCLYICPYGRKPVV
jgi:epoxyqueuosine reductase QueG